MRKAGCQGRVFPFHEAVDALGSSTTGTHRRILVVDGAVGFTGGAGVRRSVEGKRRLEGALARHAGPRRGAGRTRSAARIPGELVGGDGRGAPRRGLLPRPERSRAQAPSPSVPSSPLAAMSGAGRVYAIAIASAAKEIWIANSYFVPDDAASALLVAAVKRGVDVRVIVPSDEHNRQLPATKPPAARRSAPSSREA